MKTFTFITTCFFLILFCTFNAIAQGGLESLLIDAPNNMKSTFSTKLVEVDASCATVGNTLIYEFAIVDDPYNYKAKLWGEGTEKKKRTYIEAIKPENDPATSFILPSKGLIIDKFTKFIATIELWDKEGREFFGYIEIDSWNVCPEEEDSDKTESEK